MLRTLLGSSLFSVSLVLVTATGCKDSSGPEDPATAPIDTILVSAPATPILAGEFVTLDVVARSKGGLTLTGRSFVFSTSSSDIAKVLPSGAVTGQVPGTATITVSAEGKSTKIQVSVVPGLAATLAISPTRVVLFPDDSVQLTVRATDKVGNFIPSPTIEWVSLNPAIAAVGSSGKVHPLSEGTAAIVVRSATTSASIPVRVIGARQVSSGSNHSCFLDGDGTVYCWGTNLLFETGRDANSPVLRPAAIDTDIKFKSISAGGSHTCGIALDGSAYCWGSNARGSLGDGTTVARELPVKVKTSAAFTSIAAGWDHTCGQATDGAVYCWGGQKYTPTPTTAFTSPKFDQLYSGANLSCGLIGGTASCWGSNNHGQLGTGDDLESVTPRLVAGGLSFVQLEGWQEVTCGLTTNRSVYCWGPSFFGGCNECGTVPRLTVANLPVNRLTVGYQTFCGLDSAGAGYCVGDNGYGKLGIGPFPSFTSTPIRILPGDVGQSPFTAIESGSNHTCSIASRVVYCWGQWQALGNGGTSDLNVPKRVLTPEF